MPVTHASRFLYPHESLEWIDWAESLGFYDAPVRTHDGLRSMPKIRNNQKVQSLDILRCTMLEKRAREKGLLLENECFNPMLRVYRYSPGQEFKTHRDGVEHYNDCVSYQTVLVYLNTPEGGETVLMPNGKNDTMSHMVIEPRQGEILMFDHTMWHMAKTVNAGYKYVLRTDKMRPKT